MPVRGAFPVSVQLLARPRRTGVVDGLRVQGGDIVDQAVCGRGLWNPE